MWYAACVSDSPVIQPEAAATIISIVDHRRLTEGDLDFRARQGELWQLADARKATARIAMAWAQEILGLPDGLKQAAKKP